MALEIVISNEDDAWRWLRAALDDSPELDEPFDIRFEGWPVLNLHYEGRDFDSSVPTRIMPTLLQAQREIYRLYTQLRYGSSDTRKLTKEDREKLELVVRVSQGSSDFRTNLIEALQEAWRGALDRMDSKQILAALLFASLSLTALVGWKLWLDHQGEMQGLEHEERMEQLENDRIEMLTRGRHLNETTERVAEGIDDFRNESMRQLRPQDSLQLPNSTRRVTGEEAARLTYRPRERSQETRFDGLFQIQSVISGETEGFRVKVKQLSDGREITVDIPDATLSYDQREAIKSSEWDKTPVDMSINARTLRGEVTAATLISASIPDDDAGE